MSKNSYVNANVVPTYDTFASWLTKTNQIIYDMGTFVLTTSNTSTPDITTGNAFVNGQFGANTVYVTTGLQGGTANTPSALSITSALSVAGLSAFSANLTITGSANASVNVNAVGFLGTNITANNNLIVSNTSTLNVATAVTANIATANITTLGVTSLATVANASITTANVTNMSVTGLANIASANITTLYVTSFEGAANLSVAVANVTNMTVTGTANVGTANVGTLGVTGTATIATGVVTTANITNSTTSGTANIATANIATLGVTGTATVATAKVTTANITNETITGTSNIATANITTLGVTGVTTVPNLNIGTATSANITANSSTISFANATVTASINATNYSGTSANTTLFAGQTISTVQNWVTGNAATAYTNAVANAAYMAGVAYSNATAYSDTKAATAYSNATAYSDTKAATAYSNATAYADTKAATAFSNAIANAAASAAALYQTTAGLSANVLTLAANAATYHGNSSGTLANVVSWITGNSTTAYTNAVSYAGNGVSNGAWVAANALYANNAGGVGGVIVNTTSPSDGYVLAYDAGTAKIVFKNPSGISTVLSTNTITANAQLQAGSNGTGYVLNAYSNATSSNLVMRANNITLTVDSGAISLNSSATVTGTLTVGTNTTVNGTVIAVGNATVNTQINATSFSGTANNALYIGGTTLATIQSQITGNAATAFANAIANAASNAAGIYQTSAGLSANVATLTSNNATNFGTYSVANVQNWVASNAAAAYSNATTYASNGSNITSGTVAPARLGSGTTDSTTILYGNGVWGAAPSSVNTAAALTWTNTASFNANVNIFGNATSQLVISTINATSNGITANGSTITIGNSSVYTTVTPTAFSGTANNAIYLGGSTLTTVQNQITGNAASAYANAVANAAALYQTTAGLSANVATLTSNNSTNFATYSLSTVQGWITGNAATAFSNAIANSASLASATYLAKSGGTITGDLIVSGNLNITGTTVYANVTNLDVKDLNITVGKGAASNTASDGAGITVDTPNAQFYYSGSANSWYVNRGFTPDSNNVLNLGSSTLFWSTLYSNTVSFTGGASINATAYTGTANNSSYLSGTTLSTIQSQITGNAATAYSNGTAYADTKAATAYSNAVANAAALYQTTAGLSANVLTLTSNNSNYLGTVAAANYLNNSGAYSISGVHTHSANIVMGGNVISKPKTLAYTEFVTTIGTVSSGTATVDCGTANIFDLTLGGSVTLAFSNVPTTGQAFSVTLIVHQDATGSRTLSYPASVLWSDAITPVLATGANKTDILTFFTINGGTTWYGAQAMGNM